MILMKKFIFLVIFPCKWAILFCFRESLHPCLQEFMAKKQKPKKAGMVRRKQQKQHQKNVQRRKNRLKRPASINSPKQLEKLLGTLPLLAFDPALDDLRMDVEAFKEHHEKLASAQKTGALTDPLIFGKLIDEAFLQKLTDRLNEMEEDASPTSARGMLIRATLHQLENSAEIPHLANPLLVAIFLRTRADGLGEPLERDGIQQAMDEFEERNAEFLDHASEHPELLKTLGNFDTSEDSEDATSEEEVELPTLVERDPAVDLETLEAFWEQLQTESEEERERVEEDLELFLDDFAPPASAEWTPELIESFMSDWFLQNANPLEEDLDSMKGSLARFLEFLVTRGAAPESLRDVILPRLADPEHYRDALKS